MPLFNYFYSLNRCNRWAKNLPTLPGCNPIASIVGHCLSYCWFTFVR